MARRGFPIRGFAFIRGHEPTQPLPEVEALRRHSWQPPHALDAKPQGDSRSRVPLETHEHPEVDYKTQCEQPADHIGKWTSPDEEGEAKRLDHIERPQPYDLPETSQLLGGVLTNPWVPRCLEIR